MILEFCNCLTFTKTKKFDGFFDHEHGSQDGIHPYISGDKHYLLVPYLMIPYK